MGKLSLLLSLLPLILALAHLSNAQLYKVAEFGKSCSPGSILMPTVCKMYGRTVKCSSEFQGRCVCNLGDDAEFDEDEQACVGLVGGFCLTEATSLGRKICTKNADCEVESNRIAGHTIGTCQCLDGYQATSNKTCEEIPNYDGDKGTVRPTTPRFQTQPTSTIDPDATTTIPTTKSPPPGGNSWTISANSLIVLIAALFTLMGYNLV